MVLSRDRRIRSRVFLISGGLLIHIVVCCLVGVWAYANDAEFISGFIVGNFYMLAVWILAFSVYLIVVGLWRMDE